MNRILTLLLILAVNLAYAQMTYQDRTPYETFEPDAIYLMMETGHSFGNADISDGSEASLNDFALLQELFANQTIFQMEQEFKILAKHNEKFERIYRLKLSFGVDKDALVKTLTNLSYVQLAEKIPIFTNALVPDDPDYSDESKRWHLDHINAEGAWDVTQGCGGIKIAIVDDAVMINHEDLQANIYINTGEVPNNGVDDDNNGYIDDVNGFDVADNDPNPSPPATADENYFSHGTHVAGIAAGVSNNGLGTASIGYNSTIIPVKVKSNSSQDASSLTNPMQGVEYAIAAGADIINMSWGSYAWSYINHLVFLEADEQNIACIAAIGNDALPFSAFPAGYATVISVVATDLDDDIAYFSNYTQEAHVFSPGVNIWSAVASSTSDYGFKSGTSMSTPLVSGMVALMLCNNPSFEIPELRQCIQSSADLIPSEHIENFSIPRINAAQSVQCTPPIWNECAPSGCEMVSNGSFENPKFSDINTYNSSGAIHAGEVCSWDNYPATADVYPLNVNAPNHAAHLQCNIQLYEGEVYPVSEGLVTSDPLDFIPGNTYKLEFDYSVTKEEVYTETEFLESIEIILVYNDWVQIPGIHVVTEEYVGIGSIPYPTVDYTHVQYPDWYLSAQPPADEYYHHYVQYFVAPDDPDFRKLLIYPANAYDNLDWASTMAVFLDNISIMPVVDVVGVSSEYEPNPDDCITLTATTAASAVFWEPEYLFDDPTLLVQEICLEDFETCDGGSLQFTVTGMDTLIGCASSDTVMINIKGSDIIPPSPNVPTLMELTVCNSINYITPPTAWDNCVGAVIGEPSSIFPIQESTVIIWSFTDASNNTSTQEQVVIVIDIDDSVEQSGATLMALQADAVYQWIDCETGLAVENETNQSFDPPEGGVYAVEITYNNCVAMSPCSDFFGVGVNDFSIEQNLKILPNPTSGEMRVNYKGGQIRSIEILDLAGKSIRKTENINATEALVDLSKLTAGVYLMRVETGEGMVSKRVVKK